MSKETNTKVKVKGNYVIIYSAKSEVVSTSVPGKKMEAGIIVPDLGTYDNHKQRKHDNCYIYAVGNECKEGLKEGQEVFLEPLTQVRSFDKLTPRIEKIEGRKMAQDPDAGYLEGYFICKEENIVLVF